MESFASSFIELFKGLERAYGTYSLRRTKTVQREGEKIVGKPSTIQEPVTEQLWKDHLAGRTGIGIVPICDDSTCFFGAIDIDVYENLDLQAIINSIENNDLPLVPMRTKSGGLHCYAFVSEPIPAALMKSKMSQFAAVLGYGNCEIYPKQTEILFDRGDIGQWINMPYFRAESTDRYAYDSKGKPLSIAQFVALANKKRMSSKEFAAFTVNIVSDVSDGPPCLQHILTQGFSTGSRNDGMFCLAVYAKKAYPDTWKGMLDDYNVKYISPPLSSQEVQNIVKSLDKKEYNYTCDKNPMKSHCDLQLCRTREFGVGMMAGFLQLTGLTKYDSRPPVWFVDVDGGGRLELSTEDLQQQSKFQKRCMEALNTMPPIFKPNVWQGMIQALLETTVIIEAPTDASAKGLLFNYLERFCTSRAQAREQDEILLGKPWTDSGNHYFRMIDFMSYLDRHRFYDFKVNHISSIIKDYGGEHSFMKFKGKGVNIWKIPEFEKQTEQFSIPEHGEDVF